MLSMSISLSEYQVYLDAMNDAFESVLSQDGVGSLFDITSLKAGGKRIRGILALLSCETVSGDYHQALPVAVAFESVHSAALIQDDIIDGSQIRRHEKSLTAKHGASTAILISDIFIFEILRQLAKYDRTGLPKKRLCSLSARAHKSLISTVRGELMDIILGKKKRVQLDEYLEMVRCKTGALLSAPAACGAIVGLGSKRQVEMLADFGEAQGVAFQIIDDLIDIVGEQEVVGKPIFNDIKNCRVNLVVLHYLQHTDSPSEKKFIKGLFGRKPSRKEIEKARKLFKSSGSTDFARNLALEIAKQGTNRLNALNDNPAKNKLLNLSDMLVNREY